MTWKGYRFQAFANMSIGLLEVVASLCQVWAMKRAIDIASGVVSGDVVLSVCCIGAIVVISMMLNMLSVWMTNVWGVKAQNRMQQRLLYHLLCARWYGRSEMHSGDINNRLEQDVKNVVTFLTETLPNTVSVIALFVGAFAYLYSMDRVLALIIVCIIPVFVGLSKLYVSRMRTLSRNVRNDDSRVQAIMQETVQNRVLVKTLEAETLMVNRLVGQQKILQHDVRKRTVFSIWSGVTMNFGFAFSYLVAFGWSALRLHGGTLTFGGMTAFLQLVNKIQMPARSLTRLAPAFVQVFTAAERLMKLEEMTLEEQGRAHQLEGPCGILFENVSFSYSPDGRKVIDCLSFDFKPGTCTAILGETGGGKTTLVRLIQALVNPTSGSIYIYNKVEKRTVSSLTRCNIVYVPQGNTLISGTIRENLLLGDESASEERMEWALRLACADFVYSLPDGIDTVCSEQGGGLSEGQAQRICIARALLRDRSVMLLDEATSALDPETEKKLLDNLLLGSKRTVIFVTHREKVVDYCNSVLLINRL